MLIPFRYNLRSLRRRRLTTLMTAVGIGLTVWVFVLVLGLAEGMRNTFISTGHPLNLIVLRQMSTSETQSILTTEAVETIRVLEGIAAGGDGRPLASAERIVYVNIARRTEGSSNVIIRGLSPQGVALREQVALAEGRWFTPGLREAVVSRSIAERFLDCRPGERLRTGKAEWSVVGVFEAGPTAYGSEIWTDSSDLANAFDRHYYASVLLRARDAAAGRALSERVAADRRLQLKAQPEPAYYAEQTRSAIPLQFLGNLIAVIMAVGSCFAAMNTMYAAVAARIREVAVLRVLGYARWAVLVSFLFEAMILALLGGALGGALALPWNGVATGTTNFVSFSELTFQFRITPALLFEGLVFAVIMGTLGGFLPALRAARQPAALALRAL